MGDGFWDKLIVPDVRPQEEYASGHIPGAVSIPLDDLKKRIKEPSQEQTDRRLLPRTLVRAGARSDSLLKAKG